MRERKSEFVRGYRAFIFCCMCCMLLSVSSELVAKKDKKPSDEETIITVLRYLENNVQEPDGVSRLIIHEPVYAKTFRYGLEATEYHVGVMTKAWIVCFRANARLLTVGKYQSSHHGIFLTGKKRVKGKSLPILDIKGNTACSGVSDNPTYATTRKHRDGFIKHYKLKQIYRKKNKVFDYPAYKSEW